MLGFQASVTLCAARLHGQSANPRTMAKLRIARRPATVPQPCLEYVARIITLFSSRFAKVPPGRAGGATCQALGFGSRFAPVSKPLSGNGLHKCRHPPPGLS